ncbi:MAG: tRNA lysidine(34) synthetase TilS [Calditrichaeota bacterium]|nr:MAG: tRNA lysidine(34) synthetase TilS [Calditrichota bacterium]
MGTSLKYRFLEFVNYHQLIQAGDRILLAVSGGIDSMVLLHLMVTWQKYFTMRLGIAHFNHQLRGEEADADEAFVRRVAEEFNFPFYCERADVAAYADRHKLSLEEAARLLREDFLVSCRRQNGYRVIATAHHLTDQVETILMRLFFGAGLEGLAGIRLKKEGFIRPLLFAEKNEIIQYAREQGIEFREDSTNQDLSLLRNRIRERVLPFLKQELKVTHFQPFLRNSLIVQDWLEYLKPQWAEVKKACLEPKNENKIGLDITLYNRYFTLFKVKLVEYILHQLSGEQSSLSYQQYQAFENWLRTGKQGRKFAFNPTIYASKHGEKVWFYRTSLIEHLEVDALLNPEDVYSLEHLGIKIKLRVVNSNEIMFTSDHRKEYLDLKNIRFPLRLRNWKPRDRFQPLGMKHSKKLSDFLTDEKNLMIPKEHALVMESRGEIVYVVGVRISEKYKITSKTQKAVEVKIEDYESARNTNNR